MTERLNNRFISIYRIHQRVERTSSQSKNKLFKLNEFNIIHAPYIILNFLTTSATTSRVWQADIISYLKWSESCSVVSDSFRSHGLCSSWNSPGQNPGKGRGSLLQGMFPTQGIEPRSPTLQVDSLPAEPPGKPSLLTWIITIVSYLLSLQPSSQRNLFTESGFQTLHRLP